MRFALRSRRGPHVPIGHDGKKVKIKILQSFLYLTVLKIILLNCVLSKILMLNNSP